MTLKNPVGPVIQSGEMANAVIDAARTDNASEVFVRNRGSYVRIELDRECMILRESMERELGRPFQMRELEVSMPSFQGRIETTSDYFRFYATAN